MELENVNIQEKIETTKEDVTMQLRNMQNWKATGLEGIRGFGSRSLLVNVKG